MCREVQHKHPIALAYDFRAIFNLSHEWIGTPKLSFNEAYLLINGLLQNPESKVYSSILNVPALSQEGYLLIAIQNAIIDSIPAAKKDQAKKQKMRIKMPKPKQARVTKVRTKEEAEKAFAKFSRIKES